MLSILSVRWVPCSLLVPTGALLVQHKEMGSQGSACSWPLEHSWGCSWHQMVVPKQSSPRMRRRVVSQAGELRVAGSPPRSSPAETIQICLPGSLLWP